MAVLCPKCQDSDRISKVSAIYTGGISSGSYHGPTIGMSTPIGKGKSRVSGGYTTLRGSSQTLLSELLTPPKKPKEPRTWSGFVITFSIAFLIFLLVFIDYDAGVDDNNLLIVGMFAFFAIFYFLVFKHTRRRDPQVIEDYNNEIHIWEKAITRWDALYYCERDDILFNPESGESFPVGAMMDYLYG